MTMQRADDQFIIEVDGEVIVLRPTLRAASTLIKKYDSYGAIIQALSELKSSTLVDVIRAGSGLPLPRLFSALTHKPLRNLESTIGTVVSYVVSLAGNPSHIKEQGSDSPSAGEADTPKDTITLAEYHTRLFEIGTGILGWSPADTWNASATDILSAFKGRTGFIKELLGAVFGTAEDKTEYDPRNTTRDQEGFESLRMIAATGGNGLR